MHYDHLPIYKLALDVCVYVETIVKSFDKYFKYTVGTDLRVYSKRILFGVHKANRAYDKRIHLERLVEHCEEFKMLIQLCKELKAFRSFKQFEHVSKKAVEVARQAQAWANYTLKQQETTKQQTDTVGVLR